MTPVAKIKKNFFSVHAVKVYGGVEKLFHTFLTSPLDEGDLVAVLYHVL